VRPRDDSPAYARNWRTVLLVDALIGIVVTVVGVLAGTAGAPIWFGAALLGALYTYAVGRRYGRWRRLRVEAGLDR
jgi:hypothetical protein